MASPYQSGTKDLNLFLDFSNPHYDFNLLRRNLLEEIPEVIRNSETHEMIDDFVSYTNEVVASKTQPQPNGHSQILHSLLQKLPTILGLKSLDANNQVDNETKNRLASREVFIVVSCRLLLDIMETGFKNDKTSISEDIEKVSWYFVNFFRRKWTFSVFIDWPISRYFELHFTGVQSTSNTSSIQNNKTLALEVGRLILENMEQPGGFILQLGNDGAAIPHAYSKVEPDSLLYTSLSLLIKKIAEMYADDFTDLIWTKIDSKSNGENVDLHSCCSIGFSVTGITSLWTIEQEQKFCIQYIKHLLTLCESARAKPRKITLVGLIFLFAVSIPRFIRSYTRLLRVVIAKQFELCSEPYPSVQMMAILSLRHLTLQTADKLLSIEPRSNNPYFTNIVQQLDRLCESLGNTHASFESIPVLLECIVAVALQEPTYETKLEYLQQLLTIAHNRWTRSLHTIESKKRMDTVDLDLAAGNLGALFHALNGFYLAQEHAALGQHFTKLMPQLNLMLSKIVEGIEREASLPTDGLFANGFGIIRRNIISIIYLALDKSQHSEYYVTLAIPVYELLLQDFMDNSNITSHPICEPLFVKLVIAMLKSGKKDDVKLMVEGSQAICNKIESIVDLDAYKKSAKDWAELKHQLQVILAQSSVSSITLEIIQ